MDPTDGNNKNDEEKNHQEEVNRRYNNLVRKWSDVPDRYKTIFKIIPILIILAAIPLTVLLSQEMQNLKTNATTNMITISPTPTQTPTLTPSPTPKLTPTHKPIITPTPKFN